MDSTHTSDRAAFEAEIAELKHQLFEANETIEAIRTGQIDALVMEAPSGGHELYTLKTADQTYRFFIEQMNEGAVSLNKEGIIIYCNNQFALMVAQPLSAVIGVAFINYVNEKHQEAFSKILAAAWKKDTKTELLLKGNDLSVQLSLTLLETAKGRSLNVIVTDLTAVKKTQKELELSNVQLADMIQALEVSNHDLQQFASIASHDLQEPLRKIQMFANLLKEKCDAILSPESRKHLSKIVDSAGRMRNLIVDVLNYSKLSAKNNIFEILDLNYIIGELVDDFELVIHDKKANITAGVLPEIEANRGQIRQVFQNIISNALKFSKAAVAPVITISSVRVKEKSFDSESQADGPYCIISIKDNGIGFSEKYQSFIFALFQRLHSKDAYEGTGIGLAITKKIIEKHNGLVTAKSSPDNGAEFLLLLPVLQ